MWIITFLWSVIYPILMGFWPWIMGASAAVLAFLFSPTLRKYTVAAIAVALLLGITFIGGYNSNHTVKVVTHSCDEFRKHIVVGPVTDKAIKIFKRNGLCE